MNLNPAVEHAELHESFDAGGVTKKIRCTHWVDLHFFVTSCIQSIRTLQTPSTAESRLKLLPVCLLGLGCLTGCLPSSNIRSPFPDGVRNQLAERLQPPQQAGVTLQVRPDGTTKALNSHHFSMGEEDTIPMLIRPHSRRLPLIRCRVNGRVVYALIDTGSTRSLMDYRAALRSNLIPVSHPFPAQDEPADPPFLVEPVRGLGGSINSIFSIAKTLNFGDFQMNTLPIYILDDQWGLAGQGWLAGFRVEMLLGYDIVKQFGSVTFNYRRDKVTFSRHATPPQRNGPQSAPLFTRFGLPVVPAQFEGKAVLAAIDTGGDFGIWIPRSVADNLKLNHSPQARGLNHGKGVGGNTLFRHAGDFPIDLGGISIPPAPVHVSMQPSQGPEAPVIFIGNRILRNYTVTLDVENGRLLLVP